MPKIILFPTSGKIAQEHYEKLVKNGVKIKVGSGGIAGSEETVKLWGTTNGTNGINSTKFSLINEGDIACFVFKENIISYSRILKVLPHMKELAREVIENEIWENIIILSNLQEIEISLLEVNKLIGYSENYRVQGFNVLDKYKSDLIIEKYMIFEVKDKEKKETGDYKNYSDKEKRNEVGVFISYSHVDELYKNELKKHLLILEEKRNVKLWDDRKLEIGDNIDDKILEKINSAKVIVILISSDYFDSNYCMHIEWPYIKQNHKDKIMPVIVRDCLFKVMLEGVSTITFPLNNGNIFASIDKDREFKIIAETIDNKVMSLQEKKEE